MFSYSGYAVGMMEKKLPEWYLRKLSKAGKIGRKRSLETMTPTERTARAKKAAAASAKVRAKKAAKKRKA
jgi:hypothetical protein